MNRTNLSFKDGPYPALVGVITSMYKGVVNAAPVTWFTPCSYDPPLMMVALKKEKDTLANISCDLQFVLQTVPFAYVQEIHNLAESLPRDQSEVEKAGFGLLESKTIMVPRLAIAEEWFECTVLYIGRFGETHAQVVSTVLDHGQKTLRDFPTVYYGGTMYAANRVEDLWNVKPY